VSRKIIILLIFRQKKGVVITISGKPGDDAKHYQEKELMKKIKESQK